MSAVKHYPWLEAIRARLFNDWREGQLPQALLFSGDPGLGKVVFARQLAQFSLCERPQETGACDVCSSCNWFSAGTHPDFFEIMLEEKSRVIKVDAVRELIQKTEKTPQKANHQIVVIYPADAMHRSAANALLKTLESPPGNVYFILVTDGLQHVLPTIRSRCQVERFVWTEDAASLSWLSQHVSDAVDVELFTRLTGCASPLKINELANSDFLLYRDRLLNDLIALFEGDKCIVEISEIYAKYDVPLFFFVCYLVLYDLLQLSAGASEMGLTQIDRINELKRVQQYFDRFALLAFSARFFNAMHVYRESPAINVRLLMEEILLE